MPFERTSGRLQTGFSFPSDIFELMQKEILEQALQYFNVSYVAVQALQY